MNLILENGERTLTLAQAYEKAIGTIPTTEVITRWIKKGLKPGRHNSERIYLEAIVVGQEFRTSVEAVKRFTQATTDLRTEQPKPITTPTGRRAAAAAAKEREKIDSMLEEGKKIFTPIRGRKPTPPVTPEYLAELEASSL